MNKTIKVFLSQPMRGFTDEEIMKDKIIEAGRKIVDMLYNLYTMEDFYRPTEFYGKIILLTGRSEICEETTRIWVSKNIFEDLSLYSIIMRPKNDWRPAHQVKEDLIKKHIGFENILFAFDDDDKVNEMYKKHGVMCYKSNITKE